MRLDFQLSRMDLARTDHLNELSYLLTFLCLWLLLWLSCLLNITLISSCLTPVESWRSLSIATGFELTAETDFLLAGIRECRRTLSRLLRRVLPELF